MEIWEKESDGKWRIIDAIKYKIENQIDLLTKNKTSESSSKIEKYVGVYKTERNTSAKISVANDKETLIDFYRG